MTERRRAPRGSVTNPPAPRPDVIRLPDGRTVKTDSITGRSTRPVTHNLLSQNPSQANRKKSQGRFTPADRLWQSENTTVAVMERYGVSEKQAKGIRYTANYLMRLQREQERMARRAADTPDSGSQINPEPGVVIGPGQI